MKEGQERMKRRTLAAAYLVALTSLPLTAQESRNRPGLSLQQTFDLYVRAIHDRDLDALMSTVTSGPDFVFLTTSGRLIDSPEAYRQFHVDWFAEQGWIITFRVLKLREGIEYGYVLTKYHYEGLNAEGERYESDSYFTLIFHREDDMWKVVQDQITPIRDGSA